MAYAKPVGDPLMRRSPSLFASVLSGIVAGSVFGAANGALCHFFVGAFETPYDAFLWRACLGILGGVGVVFLRRTLWGPDISPEIGTTLGWLYGIAPGLVVFLQGLAVRGAMGKALVGLVLAGSMAGLLLGGLLDRVTEAIITRRESGIEPP